MNANKRADAGHFSGDVGRHECGERAGEEKEKHVRFPRRAITRMHFGENWRDQSVAAHRKEHARLA